MANPPKEVANLMDLILIILGIDDPNWSKAKKMLANPSNFIQNLKGYDVDGISAPLMNKIIKITSNGNFNIPYIKMVNSSSCGLM